ncbi:MAG: hypothetical protein M1820_002608 [Bogoriella megaspora]|nr:MAG: hypothetical protein M1820_002608 [Bogoriella megaspora]
MGVASNSPAAVSSADFGALFGAGYQPELQWKWEAPNPTQETSPPMTLSETYHPWRPPPSSREPQVMRNRDRSLETEDVDSRPTPNLQRFQKQLRTLDTSDNKAIHRLLHKFRGKNLLDPKASRITFEALIADRHIAKIDPDYFDEVLAHFLLNANVNTSVAHNVDCLLERLTPQRMDAHQKKSYLQLLGKLVRSDLLDLRCATKVLMQLEAIGTKSDNTVDAAEYERLWSKTVNTWKADPSKIEMQALQGFYSLVASSKILMSMFPKLRERLMLEILYIGDAEASASLEDQIERYLENWMRIFTSDAGNQAGQQRVFKTRDIVQVMHSSDKESSCERILSSLETILGSGYGEEHSKKAWHKALDIWASCIMRSGVFLTAAPDHSQCQEIVELLAPVVSPPTLALWISRLGARDGARLLLRTWVKRRILDPDFQSYVFPQDGYDEDKYCVEMDSSGYFKMINIDLKSRDPLERAKALHKLKRHEGAPNSSNVLPSMAPELSEQPSPESVTKATEINTSLSANEASFSQIQSRFELYLKQDPQSLEPTSTMPYMDLIAAIAHCGFSYRKIMVHIYHLLSRFPRPVSLAHSIHRLQNTHHILTTVHLARDLIDLHTAVEPIEALNIFRIVRRIKIRQVPDLATRIVEDGLTSMAFVRRLLIPKGSRRFLSERVDLLHRIAESWANSPHVRPLVAARFIRFLYREFSGAQVKMDSRLSRALVKASVIRPLKEQAWVSTLKFRHTLHVVRDIEGEDAATKLDQLVYQWRTRVLWASRRANWGTGKPDQEAFMKRRKLMEMQFLKVKEGREREMVKRAGRKTKRILEKKSDGPLHPIHLW